MEQRYRRLGGPPGEPGGPPGRRRGRGGELGYNKSIMLFRMNLYEIKFLPNIFLAFQFNYIHFLCSISLYKFIYFYIATLDNTPC